MTPYFLKIFIHFELFTKPVGGDTRIPVLASWESGLLLGSLRVCEQLGNEVLLLVYFAKVDESEQNIMNFVFISNL